MPKGGKRAGAGRVPSLFRVLNSEDTKDARRWFAALTAEERGEIILKLYKGEEAMDLVLDCSCGRPAVVYEVNHTFQVKALGCSCEGEITLSEESAIRVWNFEQRLASGREYLMGEEGVDINIDECLYQFGFDQEGNEHGEKL